MCGVCDAFTAAFVFPLSCLHAGGYDFPGTARCWTHITSLVVGETLDNDIPEHEVTGVLCACGLCVCVCKSVQQASFTVCVTRSTYRHETQKGAS